MNEPTTPAELEQLIQSLKSEDPETRRQPCVSLSHDPDPALLPSLVRASKDEDPFIRESVVYAMQGYDHDARAVAEVLQRAFTDPDVGLRVAAAKVLDSTSPAAMTALKNALSDMVGQVRTTAADKLAELCGERAIAFLAHQLHHDVDPEVRQSAAATLGDLGSDSIRDHLFPALSDPDPEVRASVVSDSKSWIETTRPHFKP